MKPDWSEAPVWASWLAMDRDGTWMWHEAEPTAIDLGGFWSNPDGFGKAVAAESHVDWQTKLEHRPCLMTTKPAEAGSEGQGET